MHLITIEKPCAFAGSTVQAGQHLVEDVTAGEMLIRECGTVKHLKLDLGDHVTAAESRIDQECNYNGKSIVIVRTGGYGDLLMLTPSLKAIKERWPTCSLHVACFDLYAQVYDGNPDVDVAGFYPLNVEVWNKANARIWMENVLEKGYEARTTPAIDLFAERIGIAPLVDKKLRYFVSDAERAAALARFPRTGKTRIGYQLRASADCRTYPPMKAVNMITILQKKGHEVYIFGAPEAVKQSRDGKDFVDLTSRTPPLSFRESAAVMTTCDGFIGPDSAFVHMADALSIPCVALFGPIPWEIRTGYAEKTFALQGRCSFGACHHHVRAGQIFPIAGPCQKSGVCDALDSLDPARIVAKLESLI